jgi:hypothetical protein
VTSPAAWSRLAHARASWLLRGLDFVVVKGPTVSDVLGLPPHVSGDVDVLVRASHLTRARDALAGVGFVDTSSGMRPGELAVHSTEYDDGRGPQVDVHATFPGIGLSGDALWEAVAPHVVVASVAHRDVPVLAAPAALVVLALTAARDGVGSRACSDLAASVGHDEWRAAVSVARSWEAVDGVRAGLGLVDDAYAVSLGLPERVAPSWLVRRDASSTLAARLDDLVALPWRERARLVWREAFPSRAFLRVDYPGVPVWRAHLRRWRRLLGQLPGAVRTVVRARRGTPPST